MDALSRVQDMSPRERDEMLQALNYVKAQKSTVRLSQRDYQCWNILCDALDLPNGGRPTLETFVQSFGVTKYQEAVSALHAFIDHGCADGMIPPPVRSAVLRKTMDCLVRYARALDLPLTPKSVMQMVNMARHAVEAQFPGYVAAKLLHRVAPAAA